MPRDFKHTYMTVICNDCLAQSKVNYHILGGKCRKCNSYNTTQTGGLIEEKPDKNESSSDDDEEWEDELDDATDDLNE